MLELFYYKTIQRTEIIDLHNDISKPDLARKNEKGDGEVAYLHWIDSCLPENVSTVGSTCTKT